MRLSSKITAIAVAFIFIGMVLTYLPVSHSYEFTAYNGDGEVHYSFQSDYKVEKTVVVFNNSIPNVIDRLYIYYDADYYSMVDSGSFEKTMDLLETYLGRCSFTEVSYTDSEKLIDMISKEDPYGSAILLATGSISSVVYDGTEDSPLIDWLDRGGTVVNMFGVLGKYVSTGPDSTDVIEVEGFSRLFAGVDDDSIFRDGDNAYTNYRIDSEFADPMHFTFNEYTFGIKVGSVPGQRDIGYVSEDGYSCATMFKSRNGSVINFGLNSADYFLLQIAQVIASNLNFSTTLVDWSSGTGAVEGSVAMDSSGKHIAYGFAGYSAPVFGKRIVVS